VADLVIQLLHYLGIDDVSGPWYAFWSGFGSDLGELAIVGGMLTLVRRHNCEVHKCWRIGRHQTPAAHRVCRRHHPDGHLTAAQAAAASMRGTAPEGE
jgi:hypothetical protein